MIDAEAALGALSARMEELSKAAEVLVETFGGVERLNEDITIIVEQARKAVVTTGELEQAWAGQDRQLLAVLLHRLNNDLTGALSITSLAREEARDEDARGALDVMESAGRAAAEAVRRLSASAKRI